jgi:hypothetical protein
MKTTISIILTLMACIASFQWGRLIEQDSTLQMFKHEKFRYHTDLMTPTPTPTPDWITI